MPGSATPAVLQPALYAMAPGAVKGSFRERVDAGTPDAGSTGTSVSPAIVARNWD